MPLDPELATHLEREKRMPPRASLSVEQTRDLYETAIRERYRFYSFGDAMLVL